MNGEVEEQKLESHSNLEEGEDSSSSRRLFLEAEEEQQQHSSSLPRLKIRRKTTTTPTNESISSRLPLRNLNDNNHKMAGSFKDSTLKEKGRDAGTWVRTVGATFVEPDLLGPCEPGTSIVLEGVVWNETRNGVLVVNVTWRGKSYIGTLVDCSKSEWMTPRFCDSPNNNAQDDAGYGNRCAGRKLKRSNNSHSNSNFATLINSPNAAPAKNDDSAADKNQNGAVLEPSSPKLTACPSRTCGKKFATPVALTYHQSVGHDDDDLVAIAGDSSSRDVATWTSEDDDCAAGRSGGPAAPDLGPPSTSGDGRKRRRPPSPAFSDVSDVDEAPTLEKHSTSPAKKPTASKKNRESTTAFLPTPMLPFEAIFAGGGDAPPAAAQRPTFFVPPQPQPHAQRHQNHRTTTQADPYALLAAAAAVGGSYPPYEPK